jgi:hypothetical protein
MRTTQDLINKLKEAEMKLQEARNISLECRGRGTDDNDGIFIQERLNDIEKLRNSLEDR